MSGLRGSLLITCLSKIYVIIVGQVKVSAGGVLSFALSSELPHPIMDTAIIAHKIMLITFLFIVSPPNSKNNSYIHSPAVNTNPIMQCLLFHTFLHNNASVCTCLARRHRYKRM